MSLAEIDPNYEPSTSPTTSPVSSTMLLIDDTWSDDLDCSGGWSSNFNCTTTILEDAGGTSYYGYSFPDTGTTSLHRDFYCDSTQATSTESTVHIKWSIAFSDLCTITDSIAIDGTQSFTKDDVVGNGQYFQIHTDNDDDGQYSDASALTTSMILEQQGIGASNPFSLSFSVQLT